MSDKLIKTDETYKTWIKEVTKRYQQSQIKAHFKVNEEMLRFYWSLGKDMDSIKESYPWGSNFYALISKDLTKELPDVKSFSPRNLRYMHKFYCLFPELDILPQPVANLNNQPIVPQVAAKTSSPNPFCIPWGHLRLLIDKCNGDSQKALFYISQTVENNWSRAVLMNFLSTELYERQGKAVTNFALTLPKPQSDLAQAITRDPYNFDFLTIRKQYDEKELKDALMDNITRFLLELGNGFAFVGREFKLDIGDTDNFIDMLFYNIKLHCYVVVEVKVKEFDAGDMGQLGTYMVAVNHQLKGELDGPTLGLLICKSKDNVKASYALEASSQPMGISEYDISTFLPEEYKGSLPTIEELEAEISDWEGEQ